MATDCRKYWEHAEYIPLDDLVELWCELEGKRPDDCTTAKKLAIIAAIERGEINFRRSDGKDFRDTIQDLAARKILLVEKKSFDAWVVQFINQPLIDKQLGLREETAYLNIIGALFDFISGDLQGTKKHPDFVNKTKFIEELARTYDGYYGLSKGNLEKKIKQGTDSLKKW